MPKHTRGPWEHVRISGGHWINRHLPEKDYQISIGILIPVDEVEANARLIAAAPCLLEALKMVLDCGFRQPELSEEFYEKASAAVSKAEGAHA